MKSLDPRVVRLPEIGEPGVIQPKAALDQFGAFEVFVQPKDGKPFQHEGAVHAPNLELAYILAKETFTRRNTCFSFYVASTSDVFVSPTTDGNVSAYDLVKPADVSTIKDVFEIYHLPKRGKQHIHAGQVNAGGPEEAMSTAKETLNSKTVYNIWAIRSSSIRYTSPREQEELWITLPEKKFRDAADYKGGEKLKTFLESKK
jgi:ring-1,2-phenylacetyl-CoA epoxidase subunit PaaB